MNLIRGLGEHSVPAARAAIAKILRQTRSHDERIISAERRRLGDMKAFMKSLALDNGGTYRVVVRPPRE